MHPRVLRRHGEGGKSHLTSFEGLAALSLDALSSVAYGPEAIVVVLAVAGTGAIRAALPITLAIAALLGVLTVSYCQVIAAYPDGGGSYAVAKRNLGEPVSLLAAASLVVDYTLTVAVSLSAGAASLASAVPALAPHLLVLCVGGLVVLTAVNLRGVADSARVLMVPMVLFVVSVLAVIVVGLARSHPAASVGTSEPLQATQSFGVLLVLKAFSSGCSALTGVEAIANAVPMFRTPRVRRAQRTELMLGVLLGVMLVGLSVLIRRYHFAPRGGVTLLAQMTAGAFGTGWVYYACSIVVALVLGLAANTSFGGLPVLMSLLAKDDRLPHLFALRAERPVYRFGVVVLAALALALLVAVNGDTQRLIPLYSIGVFIGFTISQIGLVKHWTRQRPGGWVPRTVVNATGAVLTGIATVVLLATKFVAGAWIVVITVPLLMVLFTRIKRYYAAVGAEISRGRIPAVPGAAGSLVIVPLGEVDKVAERAIAAAKSLGDEVVVLAVFAQQADAVAMRSAWDRWNPGVRLEIVESHQHSLVGPVVDYVERANQDGRQVAVLIPQVEPQHQRYRILQNQRGILLAGILGTRTDVIVCTLLYRLNL
ncbi:APC family permease [Actinospica sp.]|uniref:APC family permease n=1 Tax=Actinospica sp. TaxID=1872142 RepID=UPI0039C86057